MIEGVAVGVSETPEHTAQGTRLVVALEPLFALPLEPSFELGDPGRGSVYALRCSRWTRHDGAASAQGGHQERRSKLANDGPNRLAERLIGCWRNRDWWGLGLHLRHGTHRGDRLTDRLLVGPESLYALSLELFGLACCLGVVVALGALGGSWNARRYRVDLAWGGAVGAHAASPTESQM